MAGTIRVPRDEFFRIMELPRGLQRIALLLREDTNLEGSVSISKVDALEIKHEFEMMRSKIKRLEERPVPSGGRVEMPNELGFGRW